MPESAVLPIWSGAPGEVIERSPAGAIAVYLTLRGDAWFECADRTYTLRPGNILISETDLPFARGFRRGLEELVVKVDRTALPEVPQLSRPIITSSHDNGPNDLYARTLARITGRATRTSRPLAADERTVLDLVAALAAGRAAAPATAHRAAARSYIEEHLTEPSLGAEQVAAAIGISERQLSRVFAADGTSIPRHILSRRLHLAYSMLFSSAGDQRPRPWPTSLHGAVLCRQRTSPTPSASTSATEPAISAVGVARESRLRRRS